MEPGTMLRPPRKLFINIFISQAIKNQYYTRLHITAGCLGIGYYFMQHRQSETMVRTSYSLRFYSVIFFLRLSIVPFIILFLKHCSYKNNLIPLITGITILFILSLLYIPFMRDLFGLATLPFSYVIRCVIVAIISTLWIDYLKW